LKNKIVISGATGLIGKKLISALTEKGFSVSILTRNKRLAEKTLLQEVEAVEWDYNMPADEIIQVIEGSLSVINLAGASVAGSRWNDKYKKLIYDSRIETTRKIAEAISRCGEKPESLISSSATGYYGPENKEADEEANPGTDFLAKVCKDWEESALQAEKHGVRVVNIRTGVVLDKNEGALEKLIKPFKFFVGGRLGSGKQYFPWIHIEDLTEMYIFAMENQKIRGGLNGTAPQQVTNKELTKIIGKVIKRPGLFPVPGFILKIAVGEFAKNLLEGRSIIPKKALENGFKFKYETVESALKNILCK